MGSHPLGSSLSWVDQSIELGSDMEAARTEEFAAVSGGSVQQALQNFVSIEPTMRGTKNLGTQTHMISWEACCGDGRKLLE